MAPQRKTKDLIAGYLANLDEASGCKWCRYPFKPLYRSDLCRHCYGIEREIARTEHLVAQAESRGQRQSAAQRLALELDLRTAKKMAELAQAEGLAYGSIQGRNVSGLDLEHQLSFLSQHLVRKDLFWGRANLFNWAFDQSERRLLFYLLSLLKREWDRRKRRDIARGEAIL